MKKSFKVILSALCLLVAITLKANAEVDLVKSDAILTRLQNMHSGTVRGDLTSLLHYARLNWESLSVTAQTALKKYESRPTGLSKSYNKANSIFKIYYTTTGTNAVSTTDANSNSIPDYVEFVAACLDSAFHVYSRDGLAKPPISTSDNGLYPVYLSSYDAGESIYGWTMYDQTFGDNPNSTDITETDSRSSFLVLRSDYTGFSSSIETAVTSTAAHEFHHAIQFGYSYNNIMGYVSEMAASWSEAHVFSGNDDHYQYNDIFLFPDIPIDYDDEGFLSDAYSGRYYSAWIYLQYLTDRFGSSIVKDIYKLCVSNADCVALQKEISAKEFNYSQIIDDFFIAMGVISNHSVCSPYTFTFGSDYVKFGLYTAREGKITYSGTAKTYSSSTDGNGKLYRMGADYISINPSQDFNVVVSPSVSTKFAAYLLETDDTLNPNVFNKINATVKNSALNFAVKYTSGHKYTLVVINDAYSTTSSENQRDQTSKQYTIGVSAYSPLGVEQDIVESAYFDGENLNVVASNSEHATVELYNLLGVKMGTLFAGELSEGRNLVAINKDKYNRGTYFISISTNGASKSIKIGL